MAGVKNGSVMRSWRDLDKKTFENIHFSLVFYQIFKNCKLLEMLQILTLTWRLRLKNIQCYNRFITVTAGAI